MNKKYTVRLSAEERGVCQEIVKRLKGTSEKVKRAQTNRAMTLFTSLGPSVDCRGLTQVPTYRERTGHARGAAFSVSQRAFSLGWGLQGKVARTPHQSKGSGGTVCALR